MLDKARLAARERYIDDFEEAWLRGGRPVIDDHIPTDPAERTPVLVELVHADLEWRWKRGERATAEEYLSRYPELGQQEGAEADLRRAEEDLRDRERRDVAIHPPGYRVLEKLGHGSMGVVYRAIQVRLNRPVAIKVIRAGGLPGGEDQQRFLSEAEAIARLQHPNIVQIYEIGDWLGGPFLALEYIDGGNLEQRLREGPLPPRETAVLVLALARAVHYAHQQGVIHRDLKPANVLLAGEPGCVSTGRGEPGCVSTGSGEPGCVSTGSGEPGCVSSGSGEPGCVSSGRGDSSPGPNGTGLARAIPKITDFGLARRIDVAGQTATGAILGTPSYMAPEQAAGLADQIGPAADVYALGAILYECLTGRPPFKAASVLETLDQVRSTDPVPPSRLQPRLSRDLETIALKCLQKDPSRRYTQAAALADDLERFIEGRAILARPTPAWGRAWRWVRRRPIVAALILLVCLVSLMGASGIVWQWRQTVAGLQRAEENLYAQRIALADREWRANRTNRTERILAECPPELRGWEWHLLQRLCRRQLQTFSTGPSLQVACIPGPTSGRLWAASTTKGTVVVHDADSGALVRTFTGVGPAVAFSADGRRLASAAWKLGSFGELPREYDCPITIWDLQTGHPLHHLAGHTGAVFSLAFSPDGKHLASGSQDGTIRLWNLESPTSGTVLGRHSGWVEAVAFSPDGQWLASASPDSVRIWSVSGTDRGLVLVDSGNRPVNARGLVDSAKGGRSAALGDSAGLARQLRVFDVASGESVVALRGQTHTWACVAFSPDGRQVAAGRGNQVRIWDTTFGREVATLHGHTDLVRCVAFHPSGDYLASGSYDHSIKVWNLKAHQELATLRGHHDAVNAVAYSGDGARLISASWDGSVRLWDPEHAGETQVLRGHNSYVRGVTFAAGGKHLATSSADKRILLWDLSTGKAIRILTGHEDVVNSVNFDPSSQALVSASYDSTVRLWKLDTKEGSRILRGHKGKVYQAVFSPDGRQLASVGEDRTLRLWDRQTGEQAALHTLDRGRLFSVVYDPSSRWVAAAGDAGVIEVLNIRGGSVRMTLVGHQGGVTALAVSADGKTLASSGADHTVRLWDMDDGRQCRVLDGHTDAVTCLAFSADRRRLATAALDRTVRLWDVATGRELLQLHGHAGEVLSLAFSADGSQLAGTTAEGTVHVWDARAEE